MIKSRFYTLFKKAIQTLSKIGSEASDGEELRDKKRLFVLYTIFADIPSTLLQGAFCLQLHKTDAALVAFSWGFLSCLNLLFLGLIPRNFYQTVIRTILLFTVGPLAITITMGGIIQSGGYIINTIGIPVAALVFFALRTVPYWTALQVSILILCVLIDAHINRHDPAYKAEVSQTLIFTMSLVCVLAVGILYYFVLQRNRANYLLQLERNKTEALLLNVLPQDIAAILKDENRIIADQFDEASVLFADIINFTPLSSQLTPQTVVELLNDIFSQFDELVEKYGLEKIKTIGDCYMVASGIPRPRGDHAQALAGFALEMRECVANTSLHDDIQLSFRIGINSGPLIAGVIGRKKFIYDLWGDTVNTASRMESHGAAGRIQITRTTYELLKEDFICEPCGTIAVKGKGDMEVWYLESRKTLVLQPH